MIHVWQFLKGWRTSSGVPLEEFKGLVDSGCKCWELKLIHCRSSLRVTPEYFECDTWDNMMWHLDRFNLMPQVLAQHERESRSRCRWTWSSDLIVGSHPQKGAHATIPCQGDCWSRLKTVMTPSLYPGGLPSQQCLHVTCQILLHLYWHTVLKKWSYPGGRCFLLSHNEITSAEGVGVIAFMKSSIATSTCAFLS